MAKRNQKKKKQSKLRGLFPKIVFVAFVVYSLTIIIKLQKATDSEDQVISTTQGAIVQEQQIQEGYRQQLEGEIDPEIVESQAYENDYTWSNAIHFINRQ